MYSHTSQMLTANSLTILTPNSLTMLTPNSMQASYMPLHCKAFRY